MDCAADEEEVDPAEAARLAEEAADARAAAALTVSGGDPAQVLVKPALWHKMYQLVTGCL